MTAHIIVACGSGVATSETIASKVNRMLKNDGIDAEVEAINFGQVARRIKDADVYISIIRDTHGYQIPVLNGVAFLTGMGQDEEYRKLVDAINEVNSRS